MRDQKVSKKKWVGNIYFWVTWVRGISPFFKGLAMPLFLECGAWKGFIKRRLKKSIEREVSLSVEYLFLKRKVFYESIQIDCWVYVD
jgi:hypothetical protein